MRAWSEPPTQQQMMLERQLAVAGLLPQAALLALVLGTGALALVLALVVVLVVDPSWMRPLIYLHWVHHPAITRRLDRPHLFFHAHPARPVALRTDDGETLHGWHVLPGGEACVRTCAKACAGVGGDVDAGADFPHRHRLREQAAHALATDARRVFLYFHGQAGSRGGVSNTLFSARVSLMRQLATQFGAHVVAFDLRGFGDSTGTPSEAALVRDARSCWLWVRRNADPRAQLVLYGQSLGTGLCVQLASELCSSKSEDPALLVLDAPFTRIRDAASHHPLFKHLLAVLDCAPHVKERLLRSIPDPWDSLACVARCTCPVLVFHKVHDEVIPVELGRRVFAAAQSNPKASKLSQLVTIPSLEHTMRRHHIDSFCHPVWLATLGRMLEALAPKDRHK